MGGSMGRVAPKKDENDEVVLHVLSRPCRSAPISAFVLVSHSRQFWMYRRGGGRQRTESRQCPRVPGRAASEQGAQDADLRDLGGIDGGRVVTEER